MPLLTESDRSAPEIVEATLNRLAGLATLPKVAHEITAAAKDPHATAEDFYRIIRVDPALSSRVLKIANSSFYGLSCQVKSVSHAIVLLGVNAVQNIAIAGSVQKMFQVRDTDFELDLHALWSHSVAVAEASRHIARQVSNYSSEEAFLAGLIHDIGLLVIIQTHQSKFRQVLERVADIPGTPFRRAELEVIGATHEDFGGALCRKWLFPPALEYAASHHHDPARIPPGERGLCEIVHVADILADRAGMGFGRTAETDVIEDASLAAIGWTNEQCQQLAEMLPELVREAQATWAA